MNQKKGILRKLLGVLTLISSACSSSGGEVETGELELALTGSAGGVEYQLVDAEFRITGPAEVVLAPEDDGLTEISTALPAGDYSIELMEGWQLVQLEGDEQLAVEGVLLDDNPRAFSVTAETTTTISYRFSAPVGEVVLGEGAVRITIDVERDVAQELTITEIMKNPTAVGDDAGEWIELTNTGTAPFSLAGCVLSRDGSESVIDAELTLEPDGIAVLSNGATPGFAPDYVYSGLTLPNSGAFTLTISCGERVMDFLTIDPALTPNGEGHSASLSIDAYSPEGNDAPEAWCDAVDDYGGDFGTPGAANPTCI